jgi:hypothetical protein
LAVFGLVGLDGAVFRGKTGGPQEEILGFPGIFFVFVLDDGFGQAHHHA